MRVFQSCPEWKFHRRVLQRNHFYLSVRGLPNNEPISETKSFIYSPMVRVYRIVAMKTGEERRRSEKRPYSATP